MKNLIKKLNLRKKSTIALILIVVFILIIGTTVYAWRNDDELTTTTSSNVLGDNLEVELSTSQLMIREALAKKLNHDVQDISLAINEETDTMMIGLAAFDSPSQTEALNFKAEKINDRWLITEVENNFY